MRTIQIKIDYYNVTFTLFLPTELEQQKFICLYRRIKDGERIYMRDLRKWCVFQGIQYMSEFRYKKEYPVLANIWNLYSYIRFKVEERKWKTDVSCAER